MTRQCKECGQTINAPRMSESQYRDLLKDIGGSRGDKNRIVAWIKGIEDEEGVTEAIFTLEDYIANGCGIRG